MIKTEYKLFVWEDVLSDYTSGMAYAIAESVEDALNQFKKQGLYDFSIDELKSTKPRIKMLNKKSCGWVHGGG